MSKEPFGISFWMRKFPTEFIFYFWSVLLLKIYLTIAFQIMKGRMKEIPWNLNILRVLKMVKIFEVSKAVKIYKIQL